MEIKRQCYQRTAVISKNLMLMFLHLIYDNHESTLLSVVVVSQPFKFSQTKQDNDEKRKVQQHNTSPHEEENVNTKRELK